MDSNFYGFAALTVIKLIIERRKIDAKDRRNLLTIAPFPEKNMVFQITLFADRRKYG